MLKFRQIAIGFSTGFLILIAVAYQNCGKKLNLQDGNSLVSERYYDTSMYAILVNDAGEIKTDHPSIHILSPQSIELYTGSSAKPSTHSATGNPNWSLKISEDGNTVYYADSAWHNLGNPPVFPPLPSPQPNTDRTYYFLERISCVRDCSGMSDGCPTGTFVEKTFRHHLIILANNTVNLFTEGCNKTFFGNVALTDPTYNFQISGDLKTLNSNGRVFKYLPKSPSYY